MRKFISQNLSSLWLSSITLLYGVVLMVSDARIRIIEPPLRYLLIGLCIILPVIKIIALRKSWDKTRGWVLIAMAVTWWWIAWLYFINPVNNSGWILATSNVGHIFIHLARGRFEDNG